MIRIEDQEDIEAFQEAKAEIDDEFDEIIGDGVTTEKSAGTQGGAESNKANQN